MANFNIFTLAATLLIALITFTPVEAATPQKKYVLKCYGGRSADWCRYNFNTGCSLYGARVINQPPTVPHMYGTIRGDDYNSRDCRGGKGGYCFCSLEYPEIYGVDVFEPSRWGAYHGQGPSILNGKLAEADGDKAAAPADKPVGSPDKPARRQLRQERRESQDESEK